MIYPTTRKLVWPGFKFHLVVEFISQCAGTVVESDMPDKPPGHYQGFWRPADSTFMNGDYCWQEYNLDGEE